MLGHDTTVDLSTRLRCDVAGLWPKPKSLVVLRSSPVSIVGAYRHDAQLRKLNEKSYVNKGLRTCSSWSVHLDSLFSLIPAPDISAVEHNLATSHAYAPVGSCVIVLTLRDQQVLLSAHQPRFVDCVGPYVMID